MGLIGFDLCNTVANVNAVLDQRLGSRPPSVYFHPALLGNTSFFKNNLDVFREAFPLEGALDFVMNFVRFGHEIIYVTARPAESAEVTGNWLRDNGFPEAPVIFTDDKVSVARERGICLMVDDAPTETRRFRQAGIPYISPAWDYNAGDPHRFHYKRAGSL